MGSGGAGGGTRVGVGRGEAGSGEGRAGGWQEVGARCVGCPWEAGGVAGDRERMASSQSSQLGERQGSLWRPA